MICPVCNSHMIVVEHNQVELDYCTSCQGVWFDAGELELLLESMGEGQKPFLGNILDSPEAESAEKRRKCPICRQKMKKIALGHESQVLIDACRKGDGLWFDGGEVGQLIKLAVKPQGKPGPQQQVTGFLGEVFKARD